MSGTGANVVLLRARGHGSYEHLTFGGLLHHRTKLSLQAKDTVRGRRTYVVEFKSAGGYVAQVLIKQQLTVR